MGTDSTPDMMCRKFAVMLSYTEHSSRLLRDWGAVATQVHAATRYGYSVLRLG